MSEQERDCHGMEFDDRRSCETYLRDKECASLGTQCNCHKNENTRKWYIDCMNTHLPPSG